MVDCSFIASSQNTVQILVSMISIQGRNLSDNWRGGVYSYIRVMADGFLLKSTQIQKKSVGQNMNI